MRVRQRAEIADWEEKEVVQEFDDGTVIRRESWIRREAPEYSATIAFLRRPPNQTFWVKTPGKKVFEFSEGSFSANRNKAGALAVLWYRSGGFDIYENESFIPVDLVKLGKPAIATYLDVTQDISREEIADILDVTKGTIEQYISKVRRGHR